MTRLSRIFIGLTPTPVEISAGLSQVQFAFRFGADDGSESAHTWLAAQDTNINLARDTPTILRIQVDNTGDLPTQQLKLQVKVTSEPDTAYVDVPVA